MHKYLAIAGIAIVAIATGGCGGGGGGDVGPITLNITSPTAGAEYELGQPVTVAAEASADVGIDRVEFFSDGSLIDSADTTMPYSRQWDTTGESPGSHTITATAYDLDAPPNSTSKVVNVNLAISGFAVYAEDEEVSQGEQVTVSVNMVNSPPASPPAGYQMTVGYDITRLQLVDGANSVQPGSAVPASPDHIISKSVDTEEGKIRVAVVGWDESATQILQLITSNSEILTLQFQAIATGEAAIDIDPTGAATPLQMWAADASQITPSPTAVDGQVTVE